MGRTTLPTMEQMPAGSKPTFALSPIAFDLWATLLGPLSKALDVKAHDSIGYVVSAMTGCNDCLIVRKRHATDPKRDAAIQFERKVIETRGQVSESDLKAIRDAGYADADIVTIVALVAMFLTNFINNVFEPEKDIPAVTSAGSN